MESGSPQVPLSREQGGKAPALILGAREGLRLGGTPPSPVPPPDGFGAGRGNKGDTHTHTAPPWG